MFRYFNFHRKAVPAPLTAESFTAECLHVLNGTTIGTAIYILSCLCPDDFTVILEFLRIDLSQPHQHALPARKRVHVTSSSHTDVISQLRAYMNTLPAKAQGDLWLEVAQRWLLTCPMDAAYYKPDESGMDLFCQKLRNDLLDSILNIN